MGPPWTRFRVGPGRRLIHGPARQQPFLVATTQDAMGKAGDARAVRVSHVPWTRVSGGEAVLNTSRPLVAAVALAGAMGHTPGATTDVTLPPAQAATVFCLACAAFAKTTLRLFAMPCYKVPTSIGSANRLRRSPECASIAANCGRFRARAGEGRCGACGRGSGRGADALAGALLGEHAGECQEAKSEGLAASRAL